MPVTKKTMNFPKKYFHNFSRIGWLIIKLKEISKILADTPNL